MLRIQSARYEEQEVGLDRRQCCYHSCGARNCLSEAR